jgi:hypothetical protein
MKWKRSGSPALRPPYVRMKSGSFVRPTNAIDATPLLVIPWR